MGWGNCGTDSEGRPIGYNFEATCDHDGCEGQIDRGLSYACGGMHGFTEHGCEKYFCEKHLTCVETPEGDCISVCGECFFQLTTDDDLVIQAEPQEHNGE